MNMKCPRCGRIFEVGASDIGKTTTCEKCGHVFTVSRHYESDTPPPPAQTPQPAQTPRAGSNQPATSDALDGLRGCFIPLFIMFLLGIVLGCAILGYGIGNSMNSWSDKGNEVAGAIIGLAAGVFIAVVNGGLVATFLKIGEDVKRIADKIDKLK